MFDIGFAELLIIGVVALLVIGPEKLPSTIRTVSLYVNRLRRGFNDIKREVQQELHNDEVMQELRKTGQQLKHEAEAVSKDVRDTASSMADPQPGSTAGADRNEANAKPARASDEPESRS